MRAQRVSRDVEVIGGEAVVGVEVDDELCPCRPDTGVPGCTLPPVPGMSDGAEPRIVEAGNHTDRVTHGRAVVDNDRFPVLAGLANETLEALPDERIRLIEAGYDDRYDGNRGAAGARRRSHLRTAASFAISPCVGFPPGSG